MNPKWSAIIVMLFAVLTLKAQGQTSNTSSTPASIDEIPIEMSQASDAVVDKDSYAIGAELGRIFIKMGFEMIPFTPDLEVVIQGLRDSYAGKPKMSNEEILTALSGLQKRLEEKIAQDGAAYLQMNKGKQGVVELPSGLQYKVLEKGVGAHPTDTNTVEVNLIGRAIDGKEFVNSHKSKAVSFKVGEPALLPCWKEAIKLMSLGSKWQLVCKPELAYGKNGNSRLGIAPNQTVIFELELVAIK